MGKGLRREPQVEFPIPHGRQVRPRDPFERYNMIPISSTLRSKPNWTEKVFDESILTNWKEEVARALEQDRHGKVRQPHWMWKRLLSELQWLASLKTPQGEPGPVDGVWLADNVLPPELHNQFVTLVRTLLESNNIKDYHPGSNETVVDLVHPSLYCFVKQFSKVSAEANYSHLGSLPEWEKFIASVSQLEGDGESENLLDENLSAGSNEEMGEEEYSEDGEMENDWLDEPLKYYQWIPCDALVNLDGQVEILSYINGLHPFEHRPLYPVIGKILEYFIPLWNEVLRDVLTKPSYNENRLRDELRSLICYDVGEGVFASAITSFKNEPYETPIEEFLNDFVPPERSTYKLNGKQIQVIVKIASIELTPEKPLYKGSWHIEGAPRENIVATGIYYFAEENIKPSSLQFREALGDPDDTDIQNPLGFGFAEMANQYLGSVSTHQGRLLAFPNINQHCVSPVELNDRSKPGFRKILVFFLVNPTVDIVSSSRIPPGRVDWVGHGGYYSHEAAVKYREELMNTRKYYVKVQNEKLYEREYSFCEH